MQTSLARALVTWAICLLIALYVCAYFWFPRRRDDRRRRRQQQEAFSGDVADPDADPDADPEADPDADPDALPLREVEKGAAASSSASSADAASAAKPPDQLVCLVSSEDGEKYCVRRRDGTRTQQAVDLLARVVNKLQDLVDALAEKYPQNIDVARLKRNFDRRAISETLPDSTFEAVTTNKGEEIEFCLLRDSRAESDDDPAPPALIDEHTLMFVALHEITHVMCEQENHPPLFWAQFRFLLREAHELGIHTPQNYAVKPVKYCGRDINESPFFRDGSSSSSSSSAGGSGSDDGDYVP